ncbi:VOC family protein [Parahaliea aestuarii]|uniref:VOC family protein n=1 Tax=Parahaliea aestuarii TaxID=1852021 RepID=A0A5C9A2G2_9GAMM|nr:VOC family protein [Parahaliea aestuarii]TXS95055.1 VOC family protein [Parahaliea aestuarii]
MIRGVHHVAISTPNLNRLLAFYRDQLGFEEIQQTSWPRGTGQIDRVLALHDCSARQAMLKTSNLCLELFEFASPEPAPMAPDRPVCNHGHTHICMDVTDIGEVYNRLLAAGVHFHAPPQDFGGVWATYARDPDGNVFELQEIVAENDPAALFH